MSGADDHYNDMPWASWRLKSSAMQLLNQQFFQVNNEEHINAPHYWPFVSRTLPWPVDSNETQKASNAESVSMSWRSPAGTRRDNNVIMTSKRRRDVVFDVIMTLFLCRVSVGSLDNEAVPSWLSGCLPYISEAQMTLHRKYPLLY